MKSEEKQLIRVTKPYAKEDRSKSWKHLAITFFLFVFSVAAASFDFPAIIRLVVSVLIALLIVRLFAMYHDYLHGAIFRRSKVANAFFTLYGYYTLNPPSIWKRSHDYHHQHNSKLHTSSIGSFPIYTTDQYKSLSFSGRMRYLFIRHPFTILFGYIFTFWIGMCLLSLVRNPKKHWDSAIAILFHITAGGAFLVLGGWATFLYAFLIPAFISSAIGSYLFYVQHNFTDATFEPKESWNRVSAAIQSTSYLKMNPLMNWFTGNIGYHHVHHLNALIPFYHLPAAHESFVQLKAVHTTSFNPVEMYNCLKLKVWDPNLGKMLSLKEVRDSN